MIIGVVNAARTRAPPTALRALDLIEAILRDPFREIGKPEPLKHHANRKIDRQLLDQQFQVA